MNEFTADLEDYDGTPINGTVDPNCLLAFVLAGNSIFTVENTKTGGRFTFAVRLAKSDGKNPNKTWWVSLLSGPDNTSNYRYMGSIFGYSLPGSPNKHYRFKHTAKSKVSDQAPSFVAFRWTLDRIMAGNMPECVKVWHMGRCGRCGRALTVPESIRTGLGPICAGKE